MHVARWPSSPRAAPTSQAGQGVAVGENVYEAVSVSATVVRATRVQKIGASNRRASTTSARVCSFSAAVHTAQPQDHLFPYCTGALHRSCSLEKYKISTCIVTEFIFSVSSRKFAPNFPQILAGAVLGPAASAVCALACRACRANWPLRLLWHWRRARQARRGN